MVRDLSKRNIVFILILVTVLLSIHAGIIIYLDPFFHYHSPRGDYYYVRPETVERYINDGVARHFDYDAVITGISVSRGFNTSEFDSLFNTKSVKMIYSGGTFKETGEGIERAMRSKPETGIVLCSLFISKLYQDKDHRRSDISEYPTYLYNDSYIDDVKYVLNKEVLFGYCYPMIKARIEGIEGGVQSLDTTENLNQDEMQLTDGSWAEKDAIPLEHRIDQPELDEFEIQNVKENVAQNIVDVAKEYPDTRFVYYVPPCSIYHYKQLYVEGNLLKSLQAERIAVEMMLEQDNIEIYSFNDHTDIIEDPRYYDDAVHYVDWVSSYILKSISNNEGRITSDNAKDYLDKEENYLINYIY